MTEESDKLATARKRFKLAKEAMEDNRKRAESADRFSAGLEQWPEALKNNREEDDRPCLVMDETNQYINQIKNDQRQNKVSIKVRPVDDKADKKVAEMMQGLIRHIEDTSSADIAYDTAFEHALRGGYGYWRVLTEYASEDSFDLDIKIARIRNRFSVYLDPSRQEPDGSDSEFGFVVEKMKKDEFKKQYPKADIVSWEKDKDKDFDDWIDDETIQIVDYFFRTDKWRTLVSLPDGSTAWRDEIPPEVSIEGLRTREVNVKKIMWQKITGADVLEETEWMGKYIPIVEVIGNESEIDGKRILTGIVTAAMDAQRMHNYAISAMVENVALAPKAPFTAAVGQLEGHEAVWANANRKNIPVLPYNPIAADGIAVPPPQRQPPPGLSPGWTDIVMASRLWIQASMGMYSASIGAEGQEKSGRAILARQREGDVASFHYHDNLARSIRHTGRILIDLAPKVFDRIRIARILGEDGDPKMIMFDPGMTKPYAEARQNDGSIVMLYNPTLGKYDVSVNIGPSYSTKRQEAADTQMQMVQAAPNLLPLVGDVMIRNMDWPGADQIADRLKAMLPPQIKELENKNNTNALEAKSAQIEQAEQILMQKAETLFQKEQQLQQAEQMIQEAGQATAKDKQMLEAIKQEMESLQSDIDAERNLLAAEKARITAELKLAVNQAKLDAMSTESKGQKEKENQENIVLANLAEAILTMVDENKSIQQRMEHVQSTIAGMVDVIKSPKPITYRDGEIETVGGRRAIYDEQGNIVELSGLN